jgi:hypothetical protein
LTIGGSIPVFYKPIQDEFIASGLVTADRGTNIHLEWSNAHVSIVGCVFQ